MICTVHGKDIRVQGRGRSSAGRRTGRTDRRVPTSHSGCQAIRVQVPSVPVGRVVVPLAVGTQASRSPGEGVRGIQNDSEPLDSGASLDSGEPLDSGDVPKTPGIEWQRAQR